MLAVVAGDVDVKYRAGSAGGIKHAKRRSMSKRCASSVFGLSATRRAPGLTCRPGPGAREDAVSEGFDGSDGSDWTWYVQGVDTDNLRRIDLSVATRIAGFAGLQTRDPRGNLSPEVWTQHSNHEKIGQLMDAESLKTMMLTQLQQQLESQKSLLHEVDADTVVDFILRYKRSWEIKYRTDIDKDYDISQRILSVMEDTVYEVGLSLAESALAPDVVRRRIAEAGAERPGELLVAEEALVRFYFRNAYTGGLFCRAAGKLLQKKEVCNKAGGYSAKQQRDDITQERDDALLALQAMLEAPGDSRMKQCEALLHSAVFGDWVSDHKLEGVGATSEEGGEGVPAEVVN